MRASIHLMKHCMIAPGSRLQRALSYWESKRGSRLMPARRDLDPIDIPDLLAFVVLTDVTHDPLDFRYRLVGTGVVARSADDYTGMRLADLPGKGPGSMLWELRAAVVREQRPMLDDQTPYVGPAKNVRHIREIHMPLSADGKQVDMIFSVMEFDETV